jgi:tetratricopeptide (TPR) repeat protein
VFWVHADNETTFTQDYKVIAKRLGLAGGLDGPELLTAVRERIEADPCWLLVLDNADNLAVFGVGRTQPGAEEKHGLCDFVPRGPAGTVLWTSRDKRIGGSLVGARRAIHVGGMTEGEAMTLLEAVRDEEIGEAEAQGAAALLAELEWLPLAVSQAVAYMRRTSTPIDEYLSRLRRRIKRWEVLGETEFDRHRRGHVSNSVLQTWDISIEHVREENQVACNILHALAYLDNQNIPFALIAKIAETMGRPAGDREATTASAAGNNRDRNQDDNDDVRAAVVLLQDFCFLRLRTSDDRRGAYDMHKLVQEATQCSLRQETRRTDERRFSEVALRAVADLFPERRRELWEECERYLVHAQRAAGWAELCRGEVEAAALLSGVSDYLFDRGRWREKEPVDKKAYAFRKQVLGEKHPDTIWSMASLATTYHARGRYDEAEKIKVEVLALRREVLGEKHPDTIWSMASLAATYHGQGRYDEAEKISVEVLGLRREVLGEKHPDTIRSMAELATTYHGQGRYDEAEKIKVEVLALRRDVLGEKHPDTLQAMHDLAVTWDSRKRRPEALAMMQDCFQLQRNVLGELHPSTRRSLHALHLWKVDEKERSHVSRVFGRIAQHLKARISE